MSSRVNPISDQTTVLSRQRTVRHHSRIKLTIGVVIPHMGSADVDTRKKMAELCKSTSRSWLTAGVRNGINGAKGEALLAEVKA
jgi:glyoxylate/hydroxypyruvate reductase